MIPSFHRDILPVSKALPESGGKLHCGVLRRDCEKDVGLKGSLFDEARVALFSACLGALAGLLASLVDIGVGPTDLAALEDSLFALEIYALAGFGGGLALGLGFLLLARLKRNLSIRPEHALLLGGLYPLILLTWSILACYLNWRWLPYLTDPRSMTANALLVLLLALLLLGSSWCFRRTLRKADGRILPRKIQSILFGLGGSIFVLAALHLSLAAWWDASTSEEAPETILRDLKRTAAALPFDRDDFPIIVILIDTLRADHLSCYGYARRTSPNIDRLAAEGTLFESAYASSPWTIPSVATLFSGLYPSSHGTFTASSILPEEVHTLAECLKAMGYDTGGFFGHRLLDAERGFRQGFRTSYPPGEPAWFHRKKTAIERIARLPYADALFGGRRVLARAQDWLKRRPSDKVYAYIHLFEPHTPYLPPPPYDTLFDPDYEGAPVSMHPEPEEGRYPALPEAVRRNMVALYDGEIAYVDSLLGEFFKFLKDEGLYQRALVVILSDHGEEFYEHEGWDHGNHLYREVTRVPLIIKWPEDRYTGTRVEALAGLVDLRATLLAALGYESEKQDYGHSLLTTLPEYDLAGASSRAAYGEDPDGWLSVRTPDWTYIERHTGDAIRSQVFSSTDELDQMDLMDKHPEAAAELEQRLRLWRESVQAEKVEPAELTLDAEGLRVLEGLGYLHRR